VTANSVLKQDIRALFELSPTSSTHQEEIRERLLGTVQSLLFAEAVSTDRSADSLRERFSESRCPRGMCIETYVDYLRGTVIPDSMNVYSPRCMGHMTTLLPYFVWPLGEVVLALNQNLVKREASRVLTLLERQTMAIIHRLIYAFGERFYEDQIQERTSTLGVMCSCATLANITALWIARNSCFGPANGFAGVEEEGVAAALKYYGYERAVIIGSTLMHYSFEKAASILGLGGSSLVKIAVDQRNRIDLLALREAIHRCIRLRQRIIAVVGIAGSTDCGSIDPLSEIADIAGESGIHFHVDAAWGMPLLFSRKHAHRLRGIDRADSVTADGHKQLYLPIGSGMLLLRHPRAAKAIEKETRYMLQETSGDLGKTTLEGSRPGTSLLLHASLHVIGSDGYEFLVDENIAKAKTLAAILRSRPEFELLSEPETNIVLYRFIPSELREPLAEGRLSNADNLRINELNERIQRAQCEAGRTYVSRTTLDRICKGIPSTITALRAVVGNPLTNEQDIKIVLDDQVGIAAELD